MANRAVIGRLNSTHGDGVFISQHNDNVLSISKPMEFHSKMAAGLHVFYYAQGTINSGQSVTISHNWGSHMGISFASVRPLFAVRWSYPDEIVNGVATCCYPPVEYEADFEEAGDCIEEDDDGNCEEQEDDIQFTLQEGVHVKHLNYSQIQITNYMTGRTVDNQQGSPTTTGTKTIYYAILVFHEQDWTGGAGL